MGNSGDCVDTLAVYDSDGPDENELVGVYCGNFGPDIFTASGPSIHFVFRSDSALNYRGFNASFEFGEGEFFIQRSPPREVI